jgi:hypothetical protein
MTRYTQLTEAAGTALVEAAKPFEDFAVGLAGVLARSAGRWPTPSATTVPVLVAEQVAAFSNLLSAQRDVLTHLHSAALPASVAVPKDVRVKRPANKATARTAVARPTR